MHVNMSFAHDAVCLDEVTICLGALCKVSIGTIYNNLSIDTIYDSL